MPKNWYDHPNKLPSREDQIAWRRAVREIATLVGETIPFELPGQNVFLCEDCKTEPTLEKICALCANGM